MYILYINPFSVNMDKVLSSSAILFRYNLWFLKLLWPLMCQHLPASHSVQRGSVLPTEFVVCKRRVYWDKGTFFKTVIVELRLVELQVAGSVQLDGIL
jgi:hypothetical protein